MAQLQNNTTGELIYLRAQHTFGRNHHIVNTHLPEKDISQSHALICWKNNTWFLQDHSRNGTMVQGQYINQNTIALSPTTTIQFGEQSSCNWKVVNLDPPYSYLQSTSDRKKIIPLNDCYAFPNEENPHTLIYPVQDVWKIEQEGNSFILVPQQKYTIDHEDFFYVENTILEDTMDNGYVINNAYFQFLLSSDEEHIRIKIIIEHQELDLGERVHNYIILALARKRLIDAALGYVFSDQGWMDIDTLIHDICKEFGKEVDAYYLNLKIFRFRKQLMNMKPYGNLFSDIIERRQGEIRFAHPYFQIIKEEECLGKILAVTH